MRNFRFRHFPIIIGSMTILSVVAFWAQAEQTITISNEAAKKKTDEFTEFVSESTGSTVPVNKESEKGEPETAKKSGKGKVKKSAKKGRIKRNWKPTAKLPEKLVQVEKKYSTSKTLVAEFEQVKNIKALNRQQKSRGKISLKRPDKIRWETQFPDENLLVSDGSKYWFYTPPFDEEEPGQVIVRDSSKVQSKLMNALLVGSFSVAKDMKIKKAKPADGSYTLFPKPGTAGDVRKAHITIGAESSFIEKVVLEHRGGNRTEISLKNIKLGKKLPDGQFIFEIPPNTEVMSQ